MTALWTAAQAAAATGGRSTSEWRAGGVSIDSRTVKAGDLFIALRGPSFDGHAFVAAALAKGAASAMVDGVPAGSADGAPLLRVADTFAGLTALGRARRGAVGARVIGVTGSVGKTGVKEMLKLVLGGQGRTAASAASHNNHWGVPLSLARMPADTEFGIFEMGMNHRGELADLARLARPTVAIVTAVEGTHLEFFDSVAAIADAKAEIFDGMEGGVAVLNRDSPYFERLATAARSRGVGRIIGFGAAEEADFRLLQASLGEAGTHVEAATEIGPITYDIGAHGRHWALNSLAALAAVHAVEGNVAAAAEALAGFTAPEGRGRRHGVALGGGAFTLVDESYNASPASMRAALATLGGARPRGRRIAVLGDMLELGAAAPTLHAGLAEAVRAADIDLVFTVGPLMAHLRDALPDALRAGHAARAAAVTPMVRAVLKDGDMVMIKGSHGSRLHDVVAALREGHQSNGGAARAVNDA